MKYFYLIFFILPVFAGCSSSNKSGDVVTVDIEKLSSAPSEIKLENIFYFLEAYIWRDLMPAIDTAANKGLMASIKFRSADSSPILAQLKFTKLWILNKGNVWEANKLRITALTPDVVEVYASGGPWWEPEVKVDAVVEFIFAERKLLLGIKNQKIQAVY